MGLYDDCKQQVIDVCLRLIGQGYLAGTGGNVSVRVPGQRAMAITPSNYDYVKMSAEDICIVAWDLRVLEGARKPSVESGLHAAIYEHRDDVQAVVHTHQVYASALALIGTPIPALFDEQARFLGRSVEIVPYAPSGTGWLKRNLVSRLRTHANAYLLQNHGAICLGTTAERAVFNVELLEKCAVTYLLALCTEKKVSRLPLPARELIVAMLRREQKKQARQSEIDTAAGRRSGEETP